MEGGGDVSMASSTVAEQEDGYPDATFFSAEGLPSYGFFIRHAKRISFIDARVTPLASDARPEYVLGGDVKNVTVNEKETY